MSALSAGQKPKARKCQPSLGTVRQRGARAVILDDPGSSTVALDDLGSIAVIVDDVCIFKNNRQAWSRIESRSCYDEISSEIEPLRCSSPRESS